MEMEKKTMLENHKLIDNGCYLTLILGDDEVVVTYKHKDTMNELCEYLDCLNLLITLVSGQSDCILKQGEKIEELENEKTELTEKLAKLGTEKNELFCKIEAYKDANARLGKQVKHLKATTKCLEDANDFNEQCRKMHLDAVKKDLDEAVAKNKAMSAMIDDYQKRIDNQESLIQRIRAVAEREYKERFDMAAELIDLKKQRDHFRAIAERGW